MRPPPIRDRRARQPGYIHHKHAGYDDLGMPLPSIKTRRQRTSEPSQAQLDQRRRFGAFMREMRGRSREEIAAARLARFGPPRVPYQARRETKGREYLRYRRLQRMAQKQGVPFEWHSSRGMRVPRGANGQPGRAWRQEIDGHPYGTRWMQDGVLHGSGRVYG